MPIFLILLLQIVFSSASGEGTPFAGFVNKGLVGVGRIPAGTFDRSGNGARDTLSGFSGLAVDLTTISNRNGKISGRILGLSDRGLADKKNDYTPRIQAFDFALQPYYGAQTVPQNQIQLTNTATILLMFREREFFTGMDPGVTGRQSLDSEGIALLRDGSWWIADEQGPFLHRFNGVGQLIQTVQPPAAYLPRLGGRVDFTAKSSPDSGRRENRGFEGLTVTPGGNVVALLQSPLMQDGGAADHARNTRIVQFDAGGKLTGEFVYQLTPNGNKSRTRSTLVSEIAAIDDTTFLVLERDSNGRGGDEDAPIYKKVVLVSTVGASNIEGTGYDSPPGTPGHLTLPPTDLSPTIKPVKRQDFIDLLDRTQLRKFGLNAGKNPNKDPNALSEKWEALGLMPLSDPAFPADWILLVGNDNDFKAARVFQNGSPSGKNRVEVDIMLLAYRVTLPSMKW